MEKQNYLAVLARAIQRVLRAGAAFVVALLLATAVAGCAAGPRLVDHGFAFDPISDSPGIDVLDYRYGESKAPGARMPDWVKRDIGKSRGTNTNGPMLLGDSLYIKWRINATGEVIEQTVDLRNRLPREMTNHRVYFVIKERELVIYVITPELRKPDHPVVGPNKFKYYKVLQVHPSL